MVLTVSLVVHKPRRRGPGWFLWTALALVFFLWVCETRFAAQVAAETPVGATQSSVGELTLVVSGDVPTTLRLSQADVAKLPREEVRVKDHAGKEAVYAGPTLGTLLRSAGLKFDPSTMPAKGAMASSVMVDARDGYKALFALAEIDPTASNQVILLADTKDGQPLSPAEGPWRVIVPGDKRAARCVRQVNAITVHGG